MDEMLERSQALKQAVIEFVLAAEGELAQTLETYAATQSRRVRGEHIQQDMIIDSFLLEGKFGDKTPLDLFLETQPTLPQSERQLINNWEHSFMGLFAITRRLPQGFELFNWLSAKYYTVKPNNPQTLEQMQRFKEGEILLTRIAPVTDEYWMFFGSYIPMGKLGKPKLAVAIGNFKENYKSYLYSDAPELLAEAWQSVAKYHQQFIDFFGSDEITLPGYQLNQKIAELQEQILQQRLKAAGIDDNKTLADVAQEAGIEPEEIALAAQEVGVDSKAVSQLFDPKRTTKMVMPKVELPPELKKAEQVTALSHPRWGQMFLSTYSQFKALLAAEDGQNIEGAAKLIRQYLEDPKINAFIWQRLAQQFPTQLEKILQTILQRPNFQISRDLNALLLEFNKPIEPELPEIASVPIHLHNLFEEAVAEVNKPKSKSKTKKKTTFGFQKF